MWVLVLAVVVVVVVVGMACLIVQGGRVAADGSGMKMFVVDGEAER